MAFYLNVRYNPGEYVACLCLFLCNVLHNCLHFIFSLCSPAFNAHILLLIKACSSYQLLINLYFCLRCCVQIYTNTFFLVTVVISLRSCCPVNLITISPFLVDYQSAKAARRSNKKGGQDEHEKIRHPSDTSHCGSDKSVGEFDAAESLIVLSSTTSQKDKNPKHFQVPSQEHQRTMKTQDEEQRNSHSNSSGDENRSMKPCKESMQYPENSLQTSMLNRALCVNGNPMDLSPANITNSMHFKMQNTSQASSLFTDPSKGNFTFPQSGSNHPTSLSLSGQNPQPHRQIMTVTPVADHVALVDTVLNAPSLPTMVIPMDELDQHKIHRVNPNNIVFPRSNLGGVKLVTDER